MSLKTLKWTKFFTFVSGGGLAAVFTFIALFLEKPINWPSVIVGAGLAMSSLAGALGSIWPSPSLAVVDNAPTTTPGGTPIPGKTIDSSVSPPAHP